MRGDRVPTAPPRMTPQGCCFARGGKLEPMTVRVRCPAKINRFLAVGPADAIGYHPIRTRFQAVGLYDDLTVSTSLGPSLQCNVALPTENTISKSIRLYGELVQIPALAVNLHKRIPMQAGLGGGSSNAAGILRALQAITGHLVTEHGLWEIAAAIGADVPFFLLGGEAVADGYGEHLTPLLDRPTEWIVLIHPGIGIATADAYRALDQLPRSLRDDDGSNDFEVVAPAECLAAKRALIERGASQALLCGSGSSVFGAFAREDSARAAAAALPPEWGVDVVPTLSREESLELHVERGS